MPRPNPSPHAACRLLCALLLCAGVATADSKAHAQTAMGEDADVRFTFVDATTGGPGSVDRLTVEYLAERNDLVLDVAPEGSSYLAPAVPLKDIGKYVVTAWKDGVPYYFSRRGRELATEEQTLHIFATTTSHDGVRISGLTVLARREESLLRLELMLQVQNDARPQVTVVGTPGSFGLALPAGLEDVTAEYHRALDPTPVAATRADGLLQLAAPLVSGLNRLRVTGVLPWREGVELTVGSDLPIESWGLLVSPDWAEVSCLELEPDPEGTTPGYKHFVGPVLEAGRTLSIRLGSGEGGPAVEQDVFTEEAAPAPAAAEPQKKGGGLPLPVLVGLGVVVLVLVLRRRRA